MTEGPDCIYKCLGCGNHLTKGSIASGNTFGAKIYSDGKRIAPNLPEFPDLTQCKKCNTFLWLRKIKESGTYFGDIKNTEWEKADRVEFLEIDDYFIALNSGIAESRFDEIYIRNAIWWAYNDRIRNGNDIFNNEDDELRWKENCERKNKWVVGIGARNEHALDEHIYVEDMEKALKMIVELLRLSAE